MKRLDLNDPDDPASEVPGPLPVAQLPPRGYVISTQSDTISEQGPVLPIVFGLAKVAARLIEKFQPSVVQPGAWAATTVYAKGSLVTGPGSGANNVYRCTFPGVSGTGGPTTTGTGITDGTVTWDYVQQLPFPQYVQTFVAALCEGEIAGAWKLWWDKETFGNLVAGTTFSGKPGITLYKGVDALTQTLPVLFDSSGYQHVALIASDSVIGPGSGTQQELPDMAVAVAGLVFGLSSNDASPADIINDLLTHVRRGRGWPTSRVDASLTGTAAGGYRVYCDAMGFRFSMSLDSERPALDWIQDILNATNSDAVWSGGKFKVVPMGDQPIAAPVYGATGYVPTNTAAFNLGPDQIRGGVELVGRRDDADCFNLWPVEFTERGTSVFTFARSTLGHVDQVDADARGELRQAPTVSLPVIYPDGTPIVALSKILCQRSLKVRNTYRFELPFNYLALEPTDIVTLTDPVLGLVLEPVRITMMSELRDGWLEFYAEEYPAGVAASTGYTPAIGVGYQPNEQLSATNIAAIIEAARTSAAKTGNQLYGSDFSSGIPVPGSGLYVGGWICQVTTGAILTTLGLNLGSFCLGNTTDPQNSQSLNTVYMFQNGRLATADWSDLGCDFRPVVAGARYAASVYLSAHRCTGRILITWYDSSKTPISDTTPDANSDTVNDLAGGTSLSGYLRKFVVAVAPVGAVYARINIRKFDTIATFTTSYLFMCRASFEELAQVVDPLDGVTRGPLVPSPWAGGPQSVVEFDAIKTGSLRTSNYAEDGSGIPTAGAKLDHTGTALKVAPDSFQAGYLLVADLTAGPTWTLNGASKGITSAVRTNVGGTNVLRVTLAHAFSNNYYAVLVDPGSLAAGSFPVVNKNSGSQIDIAAQTSSVQDVEKLFGPIATTGTLVVWFVKVW